MIGTLPDINWGEFAQWLMIFILMSRATKNEKGLASVIDFFVKVEKKIKKDEDKAHECN
jgi:hypothetical protein